MPEYKQGQVLARGVASWTTNEDSAEVVDLARFILDPMDKIVLAVRNGSPTVDLVAHYGNLRKLTALDPIPNTVACTVALTTDLVTKVAHGLQVGDAITFGTTTGGFVVGTLYYVTTTPDADTFTVSTARGGGTFNIAADGANTYSIAEEHLIAGTLTVEKFVAGTSTAPITGLEEKVIDGVAAPFRVMLCKSAAAAAAFTAYVEIRRG